MPISKVSIVITTVSEKRIITMRKCILELVSQFTKLLHNKAISIEFILIVEKNRKIFETLRKSVKDVISMYPDTVKSRVIFKLLFSDRGLGLSGARNLGIINSTGDIIAFLDDDVIPSKWWLETIINAFEEDTSLACVGGPVIPIVVLHRNQRHLLRYVVPWLFGSHPPHMWNYEGEIPFLIGSNMSFRREIFNNVGLFDMHLGFAYGSKRGIKGLVGGEETELMLRIHLLKGKFGIFMYRKARVYHIIDLRKINPFIILKRAFAFGLSTEIIYKHFSKRFGKKALIGVSSRHSRYHIENWRSLFRSILRNGSRAQRIYGTVSFLIISVFLVIGKLLGKFLTTS